MNLIRKRLVRIDANERPPGRIEPSRMGRHDPADHEGYPVITEADLEATRRLAGKEGRPRPPVREKA